MENIIELRNVEKEYDLGETKLKILKEINLKIKKSEIVTIMGPSGSGKSTLLHVLGCLDRPTKVKIILDHIDISKLDDNELARVRRDKIGFVFQFFNIIPSFTALENVELPMMFSGRSDRKQRAEELLKAMGLQHRMHHHPSQLSGGETQRVAIARALANEPKLIVADEPTGNLDSKSGKDIMDVLLKLNKEKGVTLILVTHDQNIAKCCGGRLVLLKDGFIVKGG